MPFFRSGCLVHFHETLQYVSLQNVNNLNKIFIPVQYKNDAWYYNAQTKFFSTKNNHMYITAHGEL
jgi:hypothetical protein